MLVFEGRWAVAKPRRAKPVRVFLKDMFGYMNKEL